MFYFHQIGYYAIGIRESRTTRMRSVRTYIRILCGDENLERARKWRHRQEGRGMREDASAPR